MAAALQLQLQLQTLLPDQLPLDHSTVARAAMWERLQTAAQQADLVAVSRKDFSAARKAIVGLGAAAMRHALEEQRRARAPCLKWTGKVERTSFAVDAVSLPIAAGAHTTLVVKIVDGISIESLKMIKLSATAT